jgi:hypothetical protein
MIYNPSILDLRYLKLIPQNALMTFRNYVYYLGPNATSNIWATTTNGWVLWYAFLTTTIVWDLLQTYASIKSPSINPISGILTIGNEAVNTNVEIATQIGRTSTLQIGNGASSTGDIYIGTGLSSTNNIQILHAGDNGSSGILNLGSATSTTNLQNPFTPLYAYPTTPFTQVNGLTTYGTAGTIGYTMVRSGSSVSYPGNGNADSNLITVGTLDSAYLSIPPGVWILQLEITTYVIYGQLCGISLGTTPITAGQSRIVTTKLPGMFGAKYTCNINTGANNSFVSSFNQTLCKYTNTTGSNVTIYGFIYHQQWGIGLQLSSLTAVKIA